MNTSSASKFLSRKFIMSLVAMLTAFLVVMAGTDILGYSTALAIILGFYQGANVAQTYVLKKYDKSN